MFIHIFLELELILDAILKVRAAEVQKQVIDLITIITISSNVIGATYCCILH